MRSLDDFLPVYEFSERHRVEIAAPAPRIDRALHEVTLTDVPVARALLRVRGLHPRAGSPFLEEIRRVGVILAEVPSEGVVFGLVGQFWRLRGNLGEAPGTADEFAAYDRPDVAKSVADFRIDGAGLATETRVHVPDPAARAKFARYWRVIRPFSGLIRVVLLRAAKRRAEAA